LLGLRGLNLTAPILPARAEAIATFPSLPLITALTVEIARWAALRRWAVLGGVHGGLFAEAVGFTARLHGWPHITRHLRLVLNVLIVEVLIRAAIVLLVLLVERLGRKHDAEIVLGVLKITLGHDDVARGLGVAAKLEVFVCNRLRSTTDLHVRPVALIDPAQRIATAAAAPTASAAMAVAVAVLVGWSHSKSVSKW
jgi:hypothetical protein